MKKWIKIVGLLLLALPVVVQADDFTYTTNSDNTITITDYTDSGYLNSGMSLIIPATINDLKVTCLGSSAFYGRMSLTNVAIGNNVTNIGTQAFSDCTGLTNVTIPDSVTIIGDMAFARCTHLPVVTISSNVTSIGKGAFYYCIKLTNITIPNSVTSIGDWAFENCSGLTNVTIPESITGIGYATFDHCTGLGSITIPKSITSIGNAAFRNCTNLTNVAIPDSVNNIGWDAFYHCTALGDIIIPSGITNIGDHALSQCSGLTKVYFRGNAPAVVDASAFYEANNITVYYLAGTTGWQATLAGRPTALWNPLIHARGENLGIQTNGFSFNVTGIADHVVVVEACTNLAEGIWVPVETNTLAGGSVQFSDPGWTNYPNLYYRVSMPQ